MIIFNFSIFNLKKIYVNFEMPKKKNSKNLIIGSSYDKVLIFSHGLGDDPSFCK